MLRGACRARSRPEVPMARSHIARTPYDEHPGAASHGPPETSVARGSKPLWLEASLASWWSTSFCGPKPLWPEATYFLWLEAAPPIFLANFLTVMGSASRGLFSRAAL